MNVKRYNRIDQIVQVAVELPEDERAAYLESACGGDAELRREVETVIEYQEKAGSFLESPAIEEAAGMLSLPEHQSLIGREIGRYKIIKKIGQGGMGEVYLAQDKMLSREVALKFLPEEFSQDSDRLSRFRREALTAAALNHPNICAIHEIVEADGLNYISIEYVEGQSLEARLMGKPMEMDEILDISIQTADALDEARKKNIVHRDIKSANIMLTERNLVKVLDFGLAKSLPQKGLQGASEAATAEMVTHSGMILGTVAYMSPEQALGKSLDHRSDIFSFGVVLYEMLTGRLPFKGETVQETLDSILHKEAPNPARYNDKAPDALIRVVNKMLEKKAEDRYQSVHEVWSDLRRIRQEISSGERGISGEEQSVA